MLHTSLALVCIFIADADLAGEQLKLISSSQGDFQMLMRCVFYISEIFVRKSIKFNLSFT